MKNVFDFKDYKAFLRDFELSRKSFERGFRSKLAEAIQCQSAYVSQVLSGEAHLSLEQALRAAKHLNLRENETKHFLLLVEFARAGTKELKAHFEAEIRKDREANFNIKERVGEARILNEREQATYYSGWHYLAIHLLVGLKRFNDISSIATALKISEEAVSKALIFLTQADLIVEENGKLKTGLAKIHLDRESPLITQHHTNWRMAAVQSLNRGSKVDVHYSSASTVSRKDADILRSLIVSLIENYVAVVKPSEEEVMVGFNVDFYQLVD